MGVFSERYTAEYRGHLIEVEARMSLLGKSQYDLLIDNKRTDRLEGSLGTFRLRGELKTANNETEQVLVKINQGLLGTKYHATIDGANLDLKKS